MAEKMDRPFVRRARGGRQLIRVRLQEIAPNPGQPRRVFSENSIIELAGSIRRYGLLSPLVVRPAGSGRYELIAGERRLRALKLLGESETDAMVLPVTDGESALIALIENLQREELGFFEEAEAYQALINERGVKRDELASRLCRSPSAIANRLRLLKLPPSVRAGICAGGLSERHARALLRLPDEESQLAALNRAIKEQMNVRSLENLIERMLRAPGPEKKPVKCLCRDHRMFVNAMMNTVRALQASGADVTSRVTERADGVEVTVLIPRVSPRAVQPLGETAEEQGS